MYTDFIESISENAVIVNKTVDVIQVDNVPMTVIRNTTGDSFANYEDVTHRLVLRVEEGVGTEPYAIDIFQYSALSPSTIKWDFFTTTKFTRFHLVNRPNNHRYVEGKLYYLNDQKEETSIDILPTRPDTIFFLHKELIFPVSG